MQTPDVNFISLNINYMNGLLISFIAFYLTLPFSDCIFVQQGDSKTVKI